MEIMLKLNLLIFSTLAFLYSFCQRQNARSKSDLGFMIGGAYYIGDLNQQNHFSNTNLAFGSIYRFNVHSRMSIRANLSYSSLDASDENATNSLLKNRNLSFKTSLFELASGVEFNYLPYQTGHSKYTFTPYLFAEIGFFRINPKTRYNGEWIELQPIGTEGQGTVLNAKGKYNKTQLCFPLGLGLKMSFAKNISFNIEYGLRKTFTDYIDDVKSNQYVNNDEFLALNGEMASELANRSLTKNTYSRRGNSATKDWYFMFGAMLTYRLGPPDRCFNH